MIKSRHKVMIDHCEFKQEHTLSLCLFFRKVQENKQ